MRKFSKGTLALALALLLLACFTMSIFNGCANQQSSGATTAGAPGSPEGAADAKGDSKGDSKDDAKGDGKAAEKDGPIDVTYYEYYGGGKPAPVNNPIQQEIAKITGVNILIEMELITDSSAVRQKATLFAGSNGDFPDVASLGSDSATLEIVQQMGAAGMIWDISPYLEGYPDFKKIVDATRMLREIDGHLYCWPSWVNDTPRFTDASFYTVRKDLYKQLDLPAFPQTPDEFVDMLKLARDTLKGDDGKPIIPVTGSISASYFSSLYTTAYNQGFYTPDPDTPNTDISMPLYQDKDLLMKIGKLMNTLSRENLLDKEIFTQKREQVIEKLAAGSVFSFMNITLREVYPTNDLLMQSNPDKYYVMTPIPFDKSNKSRTWAGEYPYGYSVNIINKKTVDESALKKILGLLNFLSTTDGYALAWYGREGIECVKEADGRRNYTEEFLAKTNDGSTPDREAEGLIWYTGLVYAASLADQVDAEPVMYSRPDGRESIMNTYGGAELKDLEKLSPNFDKFYDAFLSGPVYTEKISALMDLEGNLGVAFINAKDDAELERIIDKYLEDCKAAGVQDVVNERIAEIKVKYKLG